MRVKVRSGYAFMRIMRYINADGSIRKEKITETILGPAEIDATPEEVEGQEHKLESDYNETTCDTAEASTEEGFESEVDSNAVVEETEPPGAATRGFSYRCGVCA